MTGPSTESLERYAVAWSALGRLFSTPPTADLIAQIRSDELLDAWPLPSRSADAGLTELRRSAELHEDAQATEFDYLALVRGPDTLLAPPWESVYRSAEGVVFDESTLEVRAAYARFGLVAPRLNQDPDDHVSLELGFVSGLLQAAIAEPEEAREPFLQAYFDFLQEHLLQWVPTFFARVTAGARTHFYRGIGLLGTAAAAQARHGVAGT